MRLSVFIVIYLSTIKGPNWSSTVVLLDYCGLTDSQCPAVVAGLWRTDVSLSLQQLKHIVHFVHVFSIGLLEYIQSSDSPVAVYP